MLKNRQLFATAVRDYSWLFVTIRDYSEFSQTHIRCHSENIFRNIYNFL